MDAGFAKTEKEEHYSTMRRIIFYSWQSDLPNACNRGLIQTALEEATAAITADDTIAVEPVVDRDTQNVPGAPDISSTIFGKIAGADIFVADISIVTRADGKRSTPNPNVLIELGYALRSLGHERVILVFNKAFGSIEELPFDLRMRRVLAYEIVESATERAPTRKPLATQLNAAIRAALAAIPKETAAEVSIPAVTAIENVQPNRLLVLRRNLDDILRKIDATEPRKARDGGTADELIEGIGRTQEVVAEFSRIAEVIAVMNDGEAAVETVRWFGKLFERYDHPQGFSGRFSNADQDYCKFVGHEMFITVVAFLIREQRWDALHRALDEPIPMGYLRNQGAGNVGWEYASAHLALLLDESPKRRRLSIHADLLSSRHSNGGGLAAVLGLEDLMSADFFLFLLSQRLPDPSGRRLRYWRAWSCLYLEQVPMFIRNAERNRVAEDLTKTLGLADVGELKKLLAESGPHVGDLFRDGFWRYPIDSQDIDRIGTR